MNEMMIYKVYTFQMKTLRRRKQHKMTKNREVEGRMLPLDGTLWKILCDIKI